MHSLRLTYHSLRLLLGFIFLSLPLTILAEPLSGIQPLNYLQAAQIYSLLKKESIRPLLTAQEQEIFLRELENTPPDWSKWGKEG